MGTDPGFQLSRLFNVTPKCAHLRGLYPVLMDGSINGAILRMSSVKRFSNSYAESRQMSVLLICAKL